MSYQGALYATKISQSDFLPPSWQPPSETILLLWLLEYGTTEPQFPQKLRFNFGEER